jgi:hypothetical protein
LKFGADYALYDGKYVNTLLKLFFSDYANLFRCKTAGVKEHAHAHTLVSIQSFRHPLSIREMLAFQRCAAAVKKRAVVATVVSKCVDAPNEECKSADCCHGQCGVDAYNVKATGIKRKRISDHPFTGNVAHAPHSPVYASSLSSAASGAHLDKSNTVSSSQHSSDQCFLPCGCPFEKIVAPSTGGATLILTPLSLRPNSSGTLSSINETEYGCCCLRSCFYFSSQFFYVQWYLKYPHSISPILLQWYREA